MLGSGSYSFKCDSTDKQRMVGYCHALLHKNVTISRMVGSNVTMSYLQLTTLSDIQDLQCYIYMFNNT